MVYGGLVVVPAEIHMMFRELYWSQDAEHIVLKRDMNGIMLLLILQDKNSTDLLHCMLRQKEMKKVV